MCQGKTLNLIVSPGKRETKQEQRKGRWFRFLPSPKPDFHNLMGAELKRRGRAGEGVALAVSNY